MQHEPFNEHMTDRIANRRPLQDIPQHQLDQVDAAALNGARKVDAIADAGRQAGATVDRSPASHSLYSRIGDRHGDPLAELRECGHLMAAPIQPRYVYCASPKRVFCEGCLAAFFADDGEEIKDYDASTDCDVCGTKTEVEDLRIGNLSNGMVTYFAVKICTDCMAEGS